VRGKEVKQDDYPDEGIKKHMQRCFTNRAKPPSKFKDQFLDPCTEYQSVKCSCNINGLDRRIPF